MKINYLLRILVIIFLLANCSHNLLKKEEETDDSDETEEDKQNIELTEQVTKILGEIYSVVYKNDDEKIMVDKKTVSNVSKRKNSFYNGSLYQGDIVLTLQDARNLFVEAIREAKEKNVDISNITTEIKDKIEKLDLRNTSDVNKEERVQRS